MVGSALIHGTNQNRAARLTTRSEHMHGAMAGNRCSPRRRSGVRTRALSQPATAHEPHIRSTRPTSDSTPCDLTSSRAPPIALSLRPAAAAKERRARCLDRALPTNHTWCFSTPLSPRRFVWSIALSRGGFSTPLSPRRFVWSIALSRGLAGSRSAFWTEGQQVRVRHAPRLVLQAQARGYSRKARIPSAAWPGQRGHFSTSHTTRAARTEHAALASLSRAARGYSR